MECLNMKVIYQPNYIYIYIYIYLIIYPNKGNFDNGVKSSKELSGSKFTVAGMCQYEGNFIYLSSCLSIFTI
jgi:hypothetical protein